MNTYIYENDTFTKHDISPLTMGEIIDGPYVIRFACEGFNTPLYYAGDNEAMHVRLLTDGKWIMHMSQFVDQMVHYSMWSGVNWIDCIRGVTFSELNEHVRLSRNQLVNTSKFKDLKKKSDKSVDKVSI